MNIGVVAPDFCKGSLTLRRAPDVGNPVGRRLGEPWCVRRRSGMSYGFECRLAGRLSGSSLSVQVLRSKITCKVKS